MSAVGAAVMPLSVTGQQVPTPRLDIPSEGKLRSPRMSSEQKGRLGIAFGSLIRKIGVYIRSITFWSLMLK